MVNLREKHSVVTGLGVISPIGIGVESFGAALKERADNFSYLDIEHQGRKFTYPVAKPADFSPKAAMAELPLDQGIIQKAQRMRNGSGSALWGLYCTLEAWEDSGLDNFGVDPQRIAIVCAGSNTQEASLEGIREKYRIKLPFLNPVYGMNFFDTDLIGIVSEVLGIQGEDYSLGAASASGNMALIHGHRLIQSGLYDVVMAIAPLMELSIYQYQGFTALGAMAPALEDKDPNDICCPFDIGHCGFVYGENAGCIILESEDHAKKREKDTYGTIAGYGITLDGNRNPNPSAEGEKRAMQTAIKCAGISIRAIDYVNTHGTASPTGDKTEAEALVRLGIIDTKANSTKSLIGHGLSAAGLVEVIACCIQMKDGFLHPNRNLSVPITGQVNWVGPEWEKAMVSYALSNSFGFGGINTSIVLKNTDR